MKKQYIFYTVTGGPSGVRLSRGVFNALKEAKECANKYETFTIYRCVEENDKRIETKVILEKE